MSPHAEEEGSASTVLKRIALTGWRVNGAEIGAALRYSEVIWTETNLSK
jgi:hypothetical protein